LLRCECSGYRERRHDAGDAEPRGRRVAAAQAQAAVYSLRSVDLREWRAREDCPSRSAAGIQASIKPFKEPCSTKEPFRQCSQSRSADRRARMQRD
jgi:hypothetical protein